MLRAVFRGPLHGDQDGSGGSFATRLARTTRQQLFCVALCCGALSCDAATIWLWADRPPDYVMRYPSPSNQRTLLIHAYCLGTACHYSALLEGSWCDTPLGPLGVGDEYGALDLIVSWGASEGYVEWQLDGRAKVSGHIELP